MSKKIKQLEEKCKVLENLIQNMLTDMTDIRKKYLSVDEARKRDYIVRTNYIGKLTDAELIKDFKKEIEKSLEDTFESCCNSILNFGPYGIWTFRKTLETYEMKQIILDTYSKKSKKEV